MKRIAILGLGLMGGSLGLALRKGSHSVSVTGYARRPETREHALAVGAVDRVAESPAACCEGADIVVLCVPIFATAGLLAECKETLPSAAIVTDVGSTKSDLQRDACDVLSGHGATFIGSHPIAGSDEAGISAAFPELYRNAVVVVTPPDSAPPEAVNALQELWVSVGARTVCMDANEHDAVLARTSHLPHVAASVLTDCVLRDDAARFLTFCGSGFRDTTRIAGGSEEIWHDILLSNRTAVVSELQRLESRLGEFRALLANSDSDALREILAEARLLRSRFSDDAEASDRK